MSVLSNYIALLKSLGFTRDTVPEDVRRVWDAVEQEAEEAKLEEGSHA